METVNLLVDSRDSFLKDTLASQSSPDKTVLMGKPNPSQASGAHDVLTPSPSLSVNSSLEPADMAYLHEIRDRGEDRSERNGWPIQQNSLTLNASERGASGSQRDHTSASKRMADGKIKTPGHGVPTSPVEANQYGHSRNGSTTSRNSQIGEMSNHLRTRLSYAMVKLKNGWQAHTLGELESMALDYPSSKLASSDQLWPLAHPSSDGFALSPAITTQLSERTADVPALIDSSPKKTKGNSEQRRNVNVFPPPTHLSASYESFRREYQGAVSVDFTARPDGPSLAPPADIVTDSRPRREAAKKQTLRLKTDDLANARANVPTTPPSRRTPKVRTPSQQAAVEKDAVETLMFMSSPGNSGHYLSATVSGSPSRNRLVPEVNMLDCISYTDRDEVGTHSKQRESCANLRDRTPCSRKPLSDADFIKMLDDTPDTSDSEGSDSHTQRTLG